MFHKGTGDVLKSGRYNLKRGEKAFLSFAPGSPTEAAGRASIIPCILPQSGGRAVPNVHVVNLGTGEIACVVGPPVARMSQFQP